MGGERKRYRWRVIDAVEESDLPPIARHLMHVLCGRADVDTGDLGDHSPSLSLLATLTGWSRRVVVNHLDVLEDGKWLVRTRPTVAAARSKKERTRYAVRVPGDPPDSSSAPGAPESGLSSASGAPELVHVTHGASAPGAHASDHPDQSAPHAGWGRAGSGEQPAAPLTPAAEVIKTKTDATAAEATAIAAEWAAKPRIKNAAALLRSKSADELQAAVRKHRQASAPTPIPDSPPPRMQGSEPTEAFRDVAAMIRAKQTRRTV